MLTLVRYQVTEVIGLLPEWVREAPRRSGATSLLRSRGGEADRSLTQIHHQQLRLRHIFDGVA